MEPGNQGNQLVVEPGNQGNQGNQLVVEPGIRGNRKEAEAGSPEGRRGFVGEEGRIEQVDSNDREAVVLVLEHSQVNGRPTV